MPAAAKPAPPKQTVVKISFADGTESEYPLTPVHIYNASVEGFTTPITLTYGAAWCAAGKPLGSIEKWL